MGILLIWPSPMLTYILRQYLDHFMNTHMYIIQYTYQHCYILQTFIRIHKCKHSDIRTVAGASSGIGIKKIPTEKKLQQKKRESQWTNPIRCERFILPLAYSVLFIYVALLRLRTNGPVAVHCTHILHASFSFVCIHRLTKFNIKCVWFGERCAYDGFHFTFFMYFILLFTHTHRHTWVFVCAFKYLMLSRLWENPKWKPFWAQF